MIVLQRREVQGCLKNAHVHDPDRWLPGEHGDEWGCYRILGDIIVGVVGVFIGGLLASLSGFGGNAGLVGSIVIAFIGACILIAILRAVSGGYRPDFYPHVTNRFGERAGPGMPTLYCRDLFNLCLIDPLMQQAPSEKCGEESELERQELSGPFPVIHMQGCSWQPKNKQPQPNRQSR